MDWLGDKLAQLIGGAVVFIAQLILSVILAVVNLVIGCFNFIFSQNMIPVLWNSLKVGDVKVLDLLMNTFMGFGIAIVIILSMYALFTSLWLPIWSGGRKGAYPTGAIVRSIVAIIFVLLSKSLVSIVFSVLRMFYVSIVNVGVNSVGLSDSISLQYDADAILSDHLNFDAAGNASDLLSGILAGLASGCITILAVTILVVVGWNLLQYFLELFERYASMMVAMMIAPLPLACVAHANTEDIAKRWFKWLLGQGILWVSQIAFFIIIQASIKSQSSFIETFVNLGVGASSSTAGFLAWACVTYGFVNIARRSEEIINKLGLIATNTGEGLFRDLNSMMAGAKTMKSAALTMTGAALGAAALLPSVGVGAIQGIGAGMEKYKTSGGAVRAAVAGAGAGIRQTLSTTGKGVANAYKEGKNIIPHPIKTTTNIVEGVRGVAGGVRGTTVVRENIRAGAQNQKDRQRDAAHKATARENNRKNRNDVDYFLSQHAVKDGEEKYSKLSAQLEGTGVTADAVLGTNIDKYMEMAKKDEGYKKDLDDIKRAYGNVKKLADINPVYGIAVREWETDALNSAFKRVSDGGKKVWDDSAADAAVIKDNWGEQAKKTQTEENSKTNFAKLVEQVPDRESKDKLSTIERVARNYGLSTDDASFVKKTEQDMRASEKTKGKKSKKN